MMLCILPSMTKKISIYAFLFHKWHTSILHSYQTELLLLGELIHMGIDFPAGTGSSIGHHKKINSSARRDVGEAASIVCRQSLDWDKHSSPSIENSPRAGAQG